MYIPLRRTNSNEFNQCFYMDISSPPNRWLSYSGGGRSAAHGGQDSEQGRIMIADEIGNNYLQDHVYRSNLIIVTPRFPQ